MSALALLPGSERPLAEAYDVALLDLDGVVYVGQEAVPHAVEALASARARGQRAAYVTNNALRTPELVAQHLRRLGVPAEPADVVTSAQAAAELLRQRVPARAPVLVAGGEGLRVAVREVGLLPVADDGDDLAAVVTGHDPDQTWHRLAEAALALQRPAAAGAAPAGGAASARLLWVASNTDTTVPSPRGRLPGAGGVVALLATATARQPDQIAGKPHPALHRASVQRTGARRPLVVGDRLDTDIEGAIAGGADSLLVLTGVTGEPELLAAPRGQRPTHLGQDLRALLVAHPRVVVRDDEATAGTARARVRAGVASVEGPDAVDRLRALCAAVWGAVDRGEPMPTVR